MKYINSSSDDDDEEDNSNMTKQARLADPPPVPKLSKTPKLQTTTNKLTPKLGSKTSKALFTPPHKEDEEIPEMEDPMDISRFSPDTNHIICKYL